MGSIGEIFSKGIEGIGFHGCLIALVSLIVGIVFMCNGRCAYGFFTIFNGAFFGIMSFLVASECLSLGALIAFVAFTLLLNVFGWARFNHFSAFRCFGSLLVYLIVIAVLLVCFPLINKMDISEFISSMALSTWSYIVFFVCVGVWLMPLIIRILVALNFMSECASAHVTVRNNDPLDHMTGDEEIIDTTD